MKRTRERLIEDIECYTKTAEHYTKDAEKARKELEELEEQELSDDYIKDLETKLKASEEKLEKSNNKNSILIAGNKILTDLLQASEEKLEVYTSIAEEAIEVTSPHFDEGYGWSKSIEQLKKKGGGINE